MPLWETAGLGLRYRSSKIEGPTCEEALGNPRASSYVTPRNEDPLCRELRLKAIAEMVAQHEAQERLDSLR